MQYLGIALIPLFMAHALWKYRSKNVIQVGILIKCYQLAHLIIFL